MHTTIKLREDSLRMGGTLNSLIYYMFEKIIIILVVERYDYNKKYPVSGTLTIHYRDNTRLCQLSSNAFLDN